MDDAIVLPILTLTRADRRLGPLMATLVPVLAATLGPAGGGIYLHGSLALGGFRWEQGDIDLLTVANEPMLLPAKHKLAVDLLALSDLAPPKGIELSVITRAALVAGRYPLPYEFHFSPAWHDRYRTGLVDLAPAQPLVDPDLAVHQAVARASGLALFGPPAATLVPPVPEAALLAALAYDMPDAAALATADLASVILNCCRTAAYLADGAIRSKAVGGAWARLHLAPGFQPLAAAALATYQHDAPLLVEAATVGQFVTMVSVKLTAQLTALEMIGPASPR